MDDDPEFILEIKQAVHDGNNVAIYCPAEKEEEYKKTYRDFPSVYINPPIESNIKVKMVLLDGGLPIPPEKKAALIAEAQRQRSEG